MLSHLIDWLTQGALDTTADAAWYAVGGFAVTAMGLLWAYLKGAGKPVLWFLGGALTSIAALLLVWLILIWSGQTLLLTIFGAIAFGVAVVYLVDVRRRELARLQGHPKGLFDFKKDFNKAAAKNVKALSRITKETQDIGTRTTILAGRLQSASRDSAREAVLNQAARTYRNAAVRYRRQAVFHQRANLAFTTAATWIFSWFQQTANVAQLQEQLTSIPAFKASAVTARGSIQTYRNAVDGLPNLSQQMNAAKADLIAAIDVSLSTMDSAIAFADGALALAPP